MIKPIKVYTRKLNLLNAIGFSFMFWIFIHPDISEKEKRETIVHEEIHFRQQLELLFVFHWLITGLIYCYNYLFKRKSRSQSYRLSPIEKESYGNERNEYYLRYRKSFGWIEYIDKQEDDISFVKRFVDNAYCTNCLEGIIQERVRVHNPIYSAQEHSFNYEEAYKGVDAAKIEEEVLNFIKKEVRRVFKIQGSYAKESEVNEHILHKMRSVFPSFKINDKNVKKYIKKTT